MTDIELQLNDIHAQAHERSEEKLSLSAALCDDVLLEEIAQIPNKMGFKIGEVADMLQIKQYVLRYWESEFEILRPKKAKNNQRIYTRKDVENAFLVRKLLYRDRFSIEGARQAMKGLKNQVKKEKKWHSMVSHVVDMREQLDEIRSALRELKKLFK